MFIFVWMKYAYTLCFINCTVKYVNILIYQHNYTSHLTLKYIQLDRLVGQLIGWTYSSLHPIINNCNTSIQTCNYNHLFPDWWRSTLQCKQLISSGSITSPTLHSALITLLLVSDSYWRTWTDHFISHNDGAYLNTYGDKGTQ